MSKICTVCGRGPKTTTTRSHSRIATKKFQYPNIQKKVVDGKRSNICTSCIKTLAKA